MKTGQTGCQSRHARNERQNQEHQSDGAVSCITRRTIPIPNYCQNSLSFLCKDDVDPSCYASCVPHVCWSTFCKSVDVRLRVSKGLIDWLHTYGAFARCTIEVPVQSPACETRRDEVQGEVDHQKWHHHSSSHAERHRCKCKWPLIAWWWCNRLPERMITAANYKQLWRPFRSFGALNKDN